MQTKDDGGPAFPTRRTQGQEHGMSLRDYFAAQALMGLLASSNATARTFDDYAEHAYQMADAILEARKR